MTPDAGARVAAAPNPLREGAPRSAPRSRARSWSSGASGDLTRRKLLPPCSRSTATACSIRAPPFSDSRDAPWTTTSSGVRRLRRARARDRRRGGGHVRALAPLPGGRLRERGGLPRARTVLEALERERGTPGNRIYYLAAPPIRLPHPLREPRPLGTRAPPGHGTAAVIVEKTFSGAIASRRADQPSRPLLVRRAADLSDRPLPRQGDRAEHPRVPPRTWIFEPLARCRYVDHVQIAVAETVGLAGLAGELPASRRASSGTSCRTTCSSSSPSRRWSRPRASCRFRA